MERAGVGYKVTGARIVWHGRTSDTGVVGNFGVGTVTPFAFNGKNLEVNATDYARLHLVAGGTYGRRFWIESSNLGYIAIVDGTASAQRLVIDGSGITRPGADNTQSLGYSSYRWSVVYAGTGTINTSDARAKKVRGGLDDAELAAAREIGGSIAIYQLLDAVERKGNAARWHVGVIAQDVAKVLETHGLEPLRYAFLCFDQWPAEDAVDELRDEKTGALLLAARPARPAGDSWGIRYDELAMFLLAAQELRLRALEVQHG